MERLAQGKYLIDNKMIMKHNGKWEVMEITKNKNGYHYPTRDVGTYNSLEEAVNSINFRGEIKTEDLNGFVSTGFGYLGHAARSRLTDSNLIEAANNLCLTSSELELWCDSKTGRHRMDKVSESVFICDTREFFESCLTEDILELNLWSNNKG